MEDFNINYNLIGFTKKYSDLSLKFNINQIEVSQTFDILELIRYYEGTASVIEKKQCVEKYVNEEDFCREEIIVKNMVEVNKNSDSFVYFKNPMEWFIPANVLNMNVSPHFNTHQYSVLILRDEGSNGDQEMMAFLNGAGFSVYNYNMVDIINIDIVR